MVGKKCILGREKRGKKVGKLYILKWAKVARKRAKVDILRQMCIKLLYVNMLKHCNLISKLWMGSEGVGSR